MWYKVNSYQVEKILTFHLSRVWQKRRQTTEKQIVRLPCPLAPLIKPESRHTHGADNLKVKLLPGLVKQEEAWVSTSRLPIACCGGTGTQRSLHATQRRYSWSRSQTEDLDETEMRLSWGGLVGPAEARTQAPKFSSLLSVMCLHTRAPWARPDQITHGRDSEAQEQLIWIVNNHAYQLDPDIAVNLHLPP